MQVKLEYTIVLKFLPIRVKLKLPLLDHNNFSPFSRDDDGHLFVCFQVRFPVPIEIVYFACWYSTKSLSIFVCKDLLHVF